MDRFPIKRPRNGCCSQGSMLLLSGRLAVELSLSSSTYAQIASSMEKEVG